MNNGWRYGFFGLALLVITIFCLAFLFESDGPRQETTPTMLVPLAEPVGITTVDAEWLRTELPAASHGRLVIVLFEGANCPPCKVFRPIFDAEIMSRGQAIRGVVFMVRNTKDARVMYDRGGQGTPSIVVYRDGKAVAYAAHLAGAREFHKIVSSFLCKE